MKITFLGGAQTVTGSSYLIQSEEVSILVDCGLYQGYEVDFLNYEKFNFDPSRINYVILTHAHLDHCGLLPKLFKEGFKGKIISTPQTRSLAEIILYDSAKLQEFKENLNSYKFSNPEILYTSSDVDSTLNLFNSYNFFESITLNDKISAELIPVGHILGAASVILNIDGKQLLFSGDIGRTDQSIINSFMISDLSKFSPDHIFMESLYGGMEHEDRNTDMMQIINIVNLTIQDGGRIIIPVFAMHRAQEILELLKSAFDFKLMPDDINVYLDSPMASNITQTYNDAYLEFNQEFKLGDHVIHYYNNKNGITSATDKPNYNRFEFPNLKNVRKSKRSLKISNAARSIIMAGSGMADGGRVVKHLYQNLDDSRNCVIFVGYQADQTLGRKLVDGAKEVTINDKLIHVNAKILYLTGFSAHADNADLITWVQKFSLKKLHDIFLIHGDLERMEILAKNLSGICKDVKIPKRLEVFDL